MQKGSCWISGKTFHVGPFVSERNPNVGWFYFWSPFVASIRGPHSWSMYNLIDIKLLMLLSTIWLKIFVAPFVASICGPHSWFSTVVLISIWGGCWYICVYFCFMQSTLNAIDLHFQAGVQQNNKKRKWRKFMKTFADFIVLCKLC